MTNAVSGMTDRPAAEWNRGIARGLGKLFDRVTPTK
jgi:hypothetical protein